MRKVIMRVRGLSVSPRDRDILLRALLSPKLPSDIVQNIAREEVALVERRSESREEFPILVEYRAAMEKQA